MKQADEAAPDARSGALGMFAMARDEVGVQMSLDNMFDPPPLAGCRLEVEISTSRWGSIIAAMLPELTA